MKKIIFLDIDGVLNSYRSCTAYGAYPLRNDTEDKFDMVAVRLIEVACKKCNAEIVLSSTWRLEKDWKNLKETLRLPIIDKTPAVLSGDRGHEISLWLEDNTIFEYVVVDDNEVGSSHKNNFVRTDPKNGLSYEDYQKILVILGTENDDAK